MTYFLDSQQTARKPIKMCPQNPALPNHSISAYLNSHGWSYPDYIWGFPKIRGTLLGGSIIRIIIFSCVYWGPLILGNYHIIFFQSLLVNYPTSKTASHHLRCSHNSIHPAASLSKTGSRILFNFTSHCAKYSYYGHHSSTATFCNKYDGHHKMMATVSGQRRRLWGCELGIRTDRHTLKPSSLN